MLEKQIIEDKIEILEDGTIQVREITRILEDGVNISQKITNRRIIEPGQESDAIQGSRLHSMLKVIHTDKVIYDYKVKQEKKGQAVQKENSSTTGNSKIK